MTGLASVTMLGGIPIAISQLRNDLRGMLNDLDDTGPLPAPTNYVRTGLRGAHWETGVAICPQSNRRTVTVIALAEDAELSSTCVALQGVDCAFPTDIQTLSVDEARRLARALLAAADMAGSPLINAKCGGR